MRANLGAFSLALGASVLVWSFLFGWVTDIPSNPLLKPFLYAVLILLPLSWLFLAYLLLKS